MLLALFAIDDPVVFKCQGGSRKGSLDLQRDAVDFAARCPLLATR